MSVFCRAVLPLAAAVCRSAVVSGRAAAAPPDRRRRDAARPPSAVAPHDRYRSAARLGSRVDGMLRQRRAARPPDARRSRCSRGARTSAPISTTAACACSAGTSRGSRATGSSESVFGTLYEGIDIDPTPALDEDRARAILAARSGSTTRSVRHAPELVVLPLDDGGYALTWRLRVTSRGRRRASTSSTRAPERRSSTTAIEDAERGRPRAPACSATRRRSACRPNAGQFHGATIAAAAGHRDLRHAGQSDPRADDFLTGRITLSLERPRRRPDNDWTDGAVVDAHVYAGYTYDYYFKRFGRRGLDNADIRIQSLVHPVRRGGPVHATSTTFPDFFVNAFYAGSGVMVLRRGPAARLHRSADRRGTSSRARSTSSRTS